MPLIIPIKKAALFTGRQFEGFYQVLFSKNLPLTSPPSHLIAHLYSIKKCNDLQMQIMESCINYGKIMPY
jgi:hypothetical protein